MEAAFRFVRMSKMHQEKMRTRPVAAGPRRQTGWRSHCLLSLLVVLAHSAACIQGAEISSRSAGSSSGGPAAAMGTAAAAAAAIPAAAAAGRGGRRQLQQVLGYDPYGYGYFDPYQAGVTPGFVNVDVNRETGLHVDVGTVTFDVSADHNYYGLGIGNVLGIGAARDRGWNFQLGGGNVLDASMTKDAGLGLWILDGLVNINIGPDGRTWEMGQVAARGSMREAVTAAPTGITAVVVDDVTDVAAAGAAAPQQVAGTSSVTVDAPEVEAASVDTFVTAPAGATAAAGGGPQPLGGSPQPLQAAAVDVVGVDAATEAPFSITTTDYDVTAEELPADPAADPTAVPAADPAAVPAVPAISAMPAVPVTPPAPLASYAAAAATRPSYLVPRPAVVVDENISVEEVAEAGAPAAAEAAASAVPGVVPEDEQWSIAAFGSDTANLARSRLAAGAGSGAAEAPGAHRACEGGDIEWTTGNKFKCKYKRKQLVRVPTYSNGIAARR